MLKVYFHDQEMAGRLSDGTSISINLVKRDIVRKEEGKEDKRRMDPT